ncbi:MAG: hypothetical protein Fur0032_13140 [Terrimicrobiaceae bacterium]
MSDNNARLACLRSLLDDGGGRIRFDRWMDAALFDPVVGYYSASISRIGADFTTWPELDASLAVALAAWWRAASPSTGRALVEVGAGNGQLAREVLRQCPWWRRPSLRIVEKSPVLAARQRARLGRSARWADSVTEALDGGNGAIYANELIDAFPCRIFRQPTRGIWEELWLEPVNQRLAETWLPAADLPDSSAFDTDLPSGSRVEVHESFHAWLKNLAPGIRRARWLFVDYGAESPEVYRRSPRGTFRAYQHHQRILPPEAYSAFGRRDLTADVNFTDIARTARSLGWEVVRSCRLGDFLEQFAPGARTSSQGQLFAPGGAASAFHVMECITSPKS